MLKNLVNSTFLLCFYAEIWYNKERNQKGGSGMNTIAFEAEQTHPEPDILLKENEELSKQVADLKEANEVLQHNYDVLMQAFLLSQKARFGAASEKNALPDGQLQLFGEEWTDLIAGELPPKTITVKEHKRPVRIEGDRKKMIQDLEVVTEECLLDAQESFCDFCASQMKEIGRKVVRREVIFIKPSVKVVEFVQATYKCEECGKDADTPFDHIVKAPVPAPLLSHSFASASLVAWIMYQKFAMSVPLYRQEKEWLRMLFPLLRLRMANWIIRCSESYLMPVYECMKTAQMKRDIIMSDETTWQCNKEPNRAASSKAFIWVHRTTPTDGLPVIILYDYTRTRNGDYAMNFLKGFSGFSVTDAYAGYEKVAGITRCLCLSHLRRYYLDAIPLGTNKKRIPGSAAAKGLAYCDKLFALERKWKELSPEERKMKRMVYSSPVLDALFGWAESVVTTQPLLKKALGYTLNHKENFMNYTLDGRIPISNNLSEQAIKIVALNRKNSLFSDSIAGANASACVFSFISTAMSNGLDAYEYLNYLFSELPGKDLSDSELLQNYLPWSEPVQEACRSSKKAKISEEQLNNESA